MSDQNAQPLYRVDRFVVPAPGRAEFLDRVRATHAVLRRQPGFVRDAIVEREAEGGASMVVTIAEWESAAAIEAAGRAVAAAHAADGFDRRALIARLGIAAEIGTYRELAL
ncbi:antibiotic biosynthesis monooxygenase [Prosthecomicrobium pneumaticum]|uniref:Heme-degrading monooxygenase HmoA n=1 Tax=Prosthecomicrobium pneumaticum TaxID=81895 RepID=A0A7W9FP57_9HYPH|nr:antibiotic biosynthesis monooxygenase [Prosthecomicrobium pneumaticum]MBB5754309.1 heme-degrading monooxygenase HmoA [Prosthecomicrobium pneumaticum]